MFDWACIELPMHLTGTGFPFANPDGAALLRRLAHPGERRIRLVLDTDAAHGIDDLFALAHALLPRQPWEIEAIYAAAFLDALCQDVREGMRQSLARIGLVLETARVRDIPVFEGVPGFLEVGRGGVPAPAVDDLIERGLTADEADPLYVVALGPPVNIAAALLLQPSLASRIVVIWLGGNGLQWMTAEEFNLVQDLLAVRVVFGSGVALVWVPRQPVASHLLVTLPEAKEFLEGSGPLGELLLDLLQEHLAPHGLVAEELAGLAPLAWLIDPACAPSRIIPSPVLGDDLRWHGVPTPTLHSEPTGTARRHVVREVVGMQRNAVLPPFFRALLTYAGHA